MVALGQIDKERVFFHLGYGSRVAIDAGDVARVEQACEEVYSDYMAGQIVQLLDICDATYEQKYLIQNNWFDAREIHEGDINRASRRNEPQKQQRIWQEEYNRVTNELAKLLRVTNYNSPDSWQWTHDRNSGDYLNIIPGVADTSVSSRALEFSVLGSGMGD
jgi:hypothetical protein